MRSSSQLFLFASAFFLTLPVHADRWQAARSFVDRFQETAVPGVCIVVAAIRDDGTVQRHSAGACDNSSVFELGSVSDVFTGVLFADALARGVVSTDTRVGALADFDMRRMRKINLMHLATHSSGLPLDPGAERLRRFGESDLVRYLSQLRIRTDPGEETDYSMLGVGLLGSLVARHQDRTFEGLLKERVTGPLRMRATFVRAPGESRSKMVNGHDSAMNIVSSEPFNALAGAGGVRSSLDDLVRFISANLSAPAGSLGEALAATHELHGQLSEAGPGVALGWLTHEATDMSPRILWQKGRTEGYSSFVGFIPEGKDIQAVAILSNAHLYETEELGEFLIGRRTEPPKLMLRKVTGPLYDYLGTYEFDTQRPLEILTDGEQLYGQFLNQPRFVLVGDGDRFESSTLNLDIEFQRSSRSRRIIGLSQRQRSEIREAEKRGVLHAPEPLLLSEASVSRLAGVYGLHDGTRILITSHESQLFVQIGDEPREPVFPATEHRFYFLEGKAEISFNFTTGSEQASSMTLEDGGRRRARKLSDL